MLTPHDHLPLHQASVPIASPADDDANRYDRYFFHGYDPHRPTGLTGFLERAP